MKKTLPAEVTLAPGDTISWSQFANKKAKEFGETHKASKVKFTADTITMLANICLSEDEDLPEDSPTVLWDCLEDICKCIEKSEEYTNMTDNETVSAAFAPEGAISIAPREVNTQEIAIVQAANEVGTTITLEEAKAQLSLKFELGNNNLLKPLPGSLITPADLGRAMCYGAKVSTGGDWIYADAVNMLMVEGHENPVIQIASMLGRAESTVYNWSRTASRVPVELRSDAIPISTYVEIATKRYDQNDEKNNEAIAELVQKAAAEKWSQGEARSHSRHRQGKDDSITDGGKKIKYRYLLVMPGSEPMLCIEEPVWSSGVLVVDLKTQEWLRDVENKIEYCQIAKEPILEGIK